MSYVKTLAGPGCYGVVAVQEIPMKYHLNHITIMFSSIWRNLVSINYSFGKVVEREYRQMFRLILIDPKSRLGLSIAHTRFDEAANLVNRLVTFPQSFSIIYAPCPAAPFIPYIVFRVSSHHWFV